MIDWTNIKKIDAHIHLMPSDVIEANKEYGYWFLVNSIIPNEFE